MGRIQDLSQLKGFQSREMEQVAHQLKFQSVLLHTDLHPKPFGIVQEMRAFRVGSRLLRSSRTCAFRMPAPMPMGVLRMSSAVRSLVSVPKLDLSVPEATEGLLELLENTEGTSET